MAKARNGQMATLGKWTPNRAAKFAQRRVDLIRRSLQEIAYCYYDVDNSIDFECSRLQATMDDVGGLVEQLAQAKAEGRGP